MTSKNLDTITNYFKHCVDAKETHRVGEFFSAEALIYRPDCIEPIQGLEAFEEKLKSCVTERYAEVKTTFNKIVEDGNQIVVALTHQAKNANTWKGFDVSGKNIVWTSLTYFLFDKEGKIIEEIVERNELNMANNLGLKLSPTTPHGL